MKLGNIVNPEVKADSIFSHLELPNKLEYYDDFADATHLIPSPASSDLWTLKYDGEESVLQFTDFGAGLRRLMKCCCAHLLSTSAPSTVAYFFYFFRRIDGTLIEQIARLEPSELTPLWQLLQASGTLIYPEYVSLKRLLQYFCVARIGHWENVWSEKISQQPLPKRDKYAAVRLGEAFLSLEDEAAIIRFIDTAVLEFTPATTAIRLEFYRYAAALICSYQYGMRPKQIALLRFSDVRIIEDGIEGIPTVHLRFTMIKQRYKAVISLVRRVKNEWAPIFIYLRHAAAHRDSFVPNQHFLGLTPDQVAKGIADQLEGLLGVRRTATDLRHTAAQRLVEAGASEEEVAAFLGHADLNTALVYFNGSASQAELVNEALGASSVYRTVVDIARNRFITPEELKELKEEQQIGGVPHGIPIAGIGGCSSGQPACPYNPITSCYGCRKFMPVTDLDIHRKVLSDMQSVVRQFFASSQGEQQSPAYLQLRIVIQSIQRTIADLMEFGLESTV